MLRKTVTQARVMPAKRTRSLTVQSTPSEVSMGQPGNPQVGKSASVKRRGEESDQQEHGTDGGKGTSQLSGTQGKEHHEHQQQDLREQDPHRSGREEAGAERDDHEELHARVEAMQEAVSWAEQIHHHGAASGFSRISPSCIISTRSQEARATAGSWVMRRIPDPPAESASRRESSSP